MDLAEFVPELVKLRVMGPTCVVCELVEHGVEHLLVGDEVEVPAVAPEPQLHLDAPVDVEPQQPRVLGPAKPIRTSHRRGTPDRNKGREGHRLGTRDTG